MFETIAIIFVGMGLLFYGMKIVRIETKQLTSRQLRILLEKWTSNRFIRMIFGFVSGAVTHSGSSASLIITNLVQSRLISVKNALPILSAANVGTVAIVFMFAINIKLGIMYLLGITAMIYSLNRKAAKFPLVGVILGLSLLLFGFQQLETGAEHLLEMEIIHSWISSMQNYFLFSIILFVLGFVLRLLTQSSSSVAILVISLGLAGIINDVQIMAMLIGAPLGAGVAMIFESKEVEGSSKQIPIFQMFYEFTGSIIFGGLLIIELLTGIPLIKSGISSIFHNTPEYVAITLLLLRLIPFIIAITFIIAEFGDKTQFSTMSIAASKPQNELIVFIGSVAGLLLGDTVGILIGKLFGAKIPKNIFKWLSVIVFMIFGILTLIEAYKIYNY